MHELEARLLALDPAAGPVRRLDEVFSVFESMTGYQLGRPVTEEGRQQVLTWLHQQRSADVFSTLMRAKYPTPRILASLTVVEKAMALAQAWCTACDVYPSSREEGGLMVSTGIDVDPWSVQSSQDRTAILPRWRRILPRAIASAHRGPSPRCAFPWCRYSR